MTEATWRTYHEEKINKEYREKDTLLILKLGAQGEESSIVQLKGGYRELGGLLMMGNSGAVFSGVDCTKLTTPDNGSEIYFKEGNNSGIRFNDCVLTLEKLVLKKQVQRKNKKTRGNNTEIK